MMYIRNNNIDLTKFIIQVKLHFLIVIDSFVFYHRFVQFSYISLNIITKKFFF